MVPTYDSTSMSSAHDSSRRHAPSPEPRASENSLSSVPFLRSWELKWTASSALMDSVTRPYDPCDQGTNWVDLVADTDSPPQRPATSLAAAGYLSTAEAIAVPV